MFGREKKERIKEEEERKKELGNYFEVNYEWKEISNEEWNYINNEDQITEGLLKNSVYAIFKKRASELGFNYKDIENVFLKQNEQFFNAISSFFYYRSTCKPEEISSYKKLLILPYQTDVQEIVAKIRKLSPEEKAEVLLEFVNKRIKIIVEDK